MPIPEIMLTDSTDGNKRDIAQRLKAWGAKAAEIFKTGGVIIDESIFDLRRVTKIFGTQIFNSPDTPDRPQRISEILSETFPEPDPKLRADFLSIPIEASATENIKTVPNFTEPHNPDRIFEKCYLIQFLRDKGVNIPHSIRLAISTLSLALGDLNNDLSFIKQILGECPDFSEEKTRYYLQQNKAKCAPYGCEALKKVVQDHFRDFEADKCSCNLAPSFDPKTGNLRKPSPIRFAYLDESDLEEIFQALEFTDNAFTNTQQLRDFTRNCLTAFDSHTSKTFLQSKKKDLKLTNANITDLLNFRDQAINLEKQETVVELSDSDKEKAIETLKKPSLIYDYGNFISQLGVVGERKNIRIVLLALTSRLTDSPISLVIKAESSSGKSWLLKKCLQVMPDESFFEYTAMSNRAMIYTEKDFSHKFIIFYEFDGESEEVNYLIRTLQSEGRIKYEYTIKVDGDFVTHSIDKEGPTGFCTTTTKAQIFDENETRIFSLFINESETQTKAILSKLGDEFETDSYNMPEAEIEEWKNIQRALEPMDVKIPYAKWLAQNVPASRVRIRRDFERVLISISACALLHQYQREQKEINGKPYIIASVIDYLIVHELLEGSLIRTIESLSPKTEQLIQNIKFLHHEKIKNLPGEDREFDHCISMTELIEKSNAARRSIYIWLAPAIENGLIEKIKSGRQVYFKPTSKIDGDNPFATSFLPDPIKLINEFSELSKGIKFIHPITGEAIEIGEKE